MQTKTILILGSILMALGVVLGAFGAHLFQPILIANGRLDTYQTAVLYHFIHGIGILAIGLSPIKKKTSIVLLMLVGIFFFSGALYVLSLSDLTILGAVAPIGGTAFITGWVILAFQIYRSPSV